MNSFIHISSDGGYVGRWYWINNNPRLWSCSPKRIYFINSTSTSSLAQPWPKWLQWTDSFWAGSDASIRKLMLKPRIYH